MKKKILKSLLVLSTAFVLFAIWYDYRYSMETAPSYEVNENIIHPKLLIATQGSQYKNFVTEGIVEALKPFELKIKIVDVSELYTIGAGEWDCIFIAHTWEIGTPPNYVSHFIKNTKNKDKIITLATSGDGSYHIEGVDAITSASVIEEADNDVNVLLEKIKKKLGIEEIVKAR